MQQLHYRRTLRASQQSGFSSTDLQHRKLAKVPLRRLTVVRATAQLSRDEVQRQLQQKERYLASLFESGKPMPRAAQVAELREEIDSLQAQLQNRPQQVRVPPAAAEQQRQSGPGPIQLNPKPPKFGPTGSRSTTKTNALADAAFVAVEEQLRANQGMGASDDREIARLEAENTMLRAEANRLLLRQQQLEQLLAEARGDKDPELLLETTNDILSRMRSKLKKQAAGV